MKKNPWVIKTLVSEQVYTDREEFLEYFYNAALEAAHRRTMSTVLLGQWRMGKTEIFKRVVNRLFFEQNPKSPDAVVPVYFSFPDSALDAKQFGIDYVKNFLRYYVGYYTAQPDSEGKYLGRRASNLDITCRKKMELDREKLICESSTTRIFPER